MYLKGKMCISDLWVRLIFFWLDFMQNPCGVKHISLSFIYPSREIKRLNAI